MRVLVVAAHPEPTSFTAALAATAARVLGEAGHAVDLLDLYAEGFDPVGGPHDVRERADGTRFAYQREQAHAAARRGFAPPLQRQVDRLVAADALLLHFPLWWFGMPAILKGWIDRTFAFGVAYGPGQAYDTGPFRGRRAMVALTTGGPEAAFTAAGRSGPLDWHLYPLEHGVLRFAGYDVVPRFVAWSAARVDDAARAAYLETYAARLRAFEQTPPMRFPAGA